MVKINSLLKKNTVNGIFQGITTGLLVTLIEGFFLLSPDTYVPTSYPLCLISFNLLLWAAMGGLSGFILWPFMKRSDFQQKAECYRVLFYLLPFALIYGTLGRIYIPLIDKSSLSVFDYHLSFVWALGILIFKFLTTRKSSREGVKATDSFVLEITAIVCLFQFCSNIKSMGILALLFSKLYNLLENIPHLEQIYYCIVYITGVLLIVGLYFLIFRATRSLRKVPRLGRKHISIGIQLLIVVIWLSCIYAWNQRAAAKIFAEIVPVHSPAIKKIPAVILIVLDTVRADRMSVYGNPGTTKKLEEFSQDALVIENGLATSPWTVPSHASLFTGLYSSEHGVHINYNTQGIIWGWPQMISHLSDSFPTLADIFLQNGYKTGAIVSNTILGFNIFKGFQCFDTRKSMGYVYSTHAFRPIFHLFCYITNICPKYVLRNRTADDINKESFALLKRFSGSPFFMFINYMDAHSPNFPPYPFNGHGLKTAFPQLYKLKQYFLHFAGISNQEQWRSFCLSQYDGDIAFLDNQLGKLFVRLKELGIYDSSLIIVTSDHGELFEEHGIWGHRCTMYQGVVQIPLLIKYPFNRQVGREEKMVTLADLYPTILSECGLPMPDNISGKIVGESSPPIVSEYYSPKNDFGEHRILYDGKYKYMQYEHKKAPELYDLEDDGRELVNLAEKRPEIVLEMETKLKDWQKAHRPRHSQSTQPKAPLSQDAIEGLKALGYIQ